MAKKKKDKTDFETLIYPEDASDTIAEIDENLARDTFNTSLDGHDHYQDLIDGLPKKKINVKIHGLMPKHEKEAMKMIADGVPLGEVADHFGIARSDIAYTNG